MEGSTRKCFIFCVIFVVLHGMKNRINYYLIYHLITVALMQAFLIQTHRTVIGVQVI